METEKASERWEPGAVVTWEKPKEKSVFGGVITRKGSLEH